MQKNWYLVYTKPKCEKKVETALSRKKIESFCPQIRKQVQHVRKSKTVYEPLFMAYIFVYTEEQNLPLVQQTEHVINLVYWKGKPAVVHPEEIELIKSFTKGYQDVKLEKIKVNPEEASRILNRPNYMIDGNLLTLKNKSIRATLPSIGFNLVAEFEGTQVFGREVFAQNKEALLQ